jgi:hypothetical protein
LDSFGAEDPEPLGTEIANASNKFKDMLVSHEHMLWRVLGNYG